MNRYQQVKFYIEIFCTLLSFVRIPTLQAIDLATSAPEEFGQFYDILPVLVWITDDVGKVIFLNEQWTSFTGSNSFDWLTFLHPDDYTETIAKRQVSFEQGKLFETKYRLRSANGDFEWFLVRAVPIADKNQMLVRWLGTSTSIHERMIREAQVEKEEQQRNSFIASIHHDCLTPLAGSIGMIELVLNQIDRLTRSSMFAPSTGEFSSGHSRHKSHPVILPKPDGEFVSKHHLQEIRLDLQTALQCNSDLLSLIENLLDISRLRAGKLSLEYVRFDVNEAIEKELQVASLREPDKVIGFDRNENMCTEIFGDPKRYSQIIRNLLSNALRYTDKEYTIINISVSLDVRGDLTTCVKDNGIGMTEEEKKNAFDAFEQADASTCRNGGSGLGLTLCRHLVMMMNGHITIQSMKNIGTSVCFSVPYKTRSSSLTIPQFTRRTSEKLERKKVILIVEDDKVLSAIMQKTLAGHYSLITVDDGIPAVEIFTENKDIDLILMDCNLKKMDGFMATRAIRKIEYEQKRTVIPIVAVTASSTEKDQTRCRASGMTDVIAKPYKPKDVLQRVKNILV